MIGVVLGFGPGLFLAFELPASYFPQEWTHGKLQEAVKDPRIHPEGVPTLSGPSGTTAAAAPSPTSRYQDRAWQVIETLEQKPTPGTAP